MTIWSRGMVANFQTKVTIWKRQNFLPQEGENLFFMFWLSRCIGHFKGTVQRDFGINYSFQKQTKHMCHCWLLGLMA